MLRTFVLIAALVCYSNLAAHADENTGTVEGTMHFSNAAPAANLALRLDGPPALLYSSTDRNGHFVFFNVIPGRYRLSIATLWFGLPYQFGGDCGVAIVIDVNPGLTWHLSKRLPAVYYPPREITHVCSLAWPTEPLQQLVSEGTTSDLYLIGNGSP
jgi:hypothetical protein